MASEEELQRMAMEMNYYKQKAEELQTQIRSIAAFIQDADAATKALESLGKEESMFSIGSGVFIKAKPSSDKVLVEIGSKIITEKSVEDAKAFLTKRKDELLKAMERLQSEIEQLNSAMVALSERAQQ